MWTARTTSLFAPARGSIRHDRVEHHVQRAVVRESDHREQLHQRWVARMGAESHADFTSAPIESGATPQAPRVIAHDFQFPRTWQSSVGVQKRLGDRLAMDVEYRSTGRNTTVRAGATSTSWRIPQSDTRAAAVADPRWGPVLWIASDARADYLALASALRRRFANGLGRCRVHANVLRSLQPASESFRAHRRQSAQC